jgi:hypothetical protein
MQWEFPGQPPASQPKSPAAASGRLGAVHHRLRPQYWVSHEVLPTRYHRGAKPTFRTQSACDWKALTDDTRRESSKFVASAQQQRRSCQ